MPEDSDRTEGDLPDPSSGETFSDLDELQKSLSEEASTASAGAEEEEGETPQGSAEADSGESDGSQGGSQGDSSDTVRMTFHVDRETAERLRNAVYWTATPVTLSGTARDALRAAANQLEEEYNNGEPFPDRDEELKGGNPNLKE
jgi:hypothetical protein